jgi:hypothetical protein
MSHAGPWRARPGRLRSWRNGLLVSLALATACIACERRDEGDDGGPLFPNRSAQPSAAGGAKTAPGNGTTAQPAAPKPVVTNDPINAVDVAWMRQRSKQIYADLIAGLGSEEQAKVRAIPLLFDERPGEINAFAACLKTGEALVAFTDTLMTMEAQYARATANDQIFGTSKVKDYLSHLKRTKGTAKPPAGLFDPTQDQDGRKVDAQQLLFSEAVAFTLGHELAHHYLSHTGCVGSDAKQATAADLGRVLVHELPALNQLNEIAADTYGTFNVLTSGKRQTPPWTENGGLLTLRLLNAMGDEGLGESLLDFERTHPHAAIRIPVVEQSARTWRATGGRSLPTIPNIPLPGL